MPPHYLEKELRDLVRIDEGIFRFLEQGSLDGLWYWDLEDPSQEWISPEFWRLFGYDPSQMPHSPDAWQDIINEDDLKTALANFQQHLDDPNHPYDQIVRYTHSDTGEPVTVRCRGIAIRDASGKPTRMLGAHTDMTAALSSEAKLIEANERLRGVLQRAEREAKANTAFLQTMSHEMRTPMNGIIGMSEALLQSQQNERQAEMTRIINRSAKFLLDMMNDILDLSRIDDGKLELEHHNILLAGMLADVEALFAPLAKERGLELSHEIAEGTPTHVHGSERALRQVLINLVSNALKFTAEGGVVIHVRYLDATSSPTLVLDVVDTGPGIADKHKDQIFQRLDRGSTSHDHEGAGLGLSIASALCKLHGGAITCADTPGGGATFTASFQVAHADSATKAPKQPEDSMLQSPPLHILVAEDNDINCLVVESMLEKCNATCDIAVNGQDALELAKTRSYDGALIDIRMPELDGVEFVQALRTHETKMPTQALPLVAYSANVLEHQIADYLQKGFDRHLSKPCSYEDFRDAIQWISQNKADASTAA